MKGVRLQDGKDGEQDEDDEGNAEKGGLMMVKE